MNVWRRRRRRRRRRRGYHLAGCRMNLHERW